jgi:hypothetical protein
VTYVPYDPSFEMPAEGGPNEPLTGDSIPRRVTPSRVQLAVFKPAQSSLFERRLVRAPISAARHERTDLWRSISIKRLPQRKHQSLARDPWSCSGLRCALNAASRHSVCCLIAAKNDRKPIVVTRSSIGLAICAASLFA